jgi:precorrin-2 methylase
LAESSARDRARSAQGRIDVLAQGNSGACNSGDPSLGGACSDLRSAIADHDRDVNVSTVGFVCAGVGAAALVTTWLAYPTRAADSSGVSVRPVLAIGRVGLQGRF